jgi:uncharacterized protein (DUF302 family)
MDRCSSFTSHSFGKFRCFSIQKASAEGCGSIGNPKLHPLRGFRSGARSQHSRQRKNGMPIKTIEVQRFSRTTSRSFEAVVASLKAGVGRLDLAAFASASKSPGTFAELEEVINRDMGKTHLMLFLEFDHGAVLRKETGLNKPKIMRLVIGNPLVMKEMAKHVPDAGSYAPVTVLVDEREDGVHLSYDKMVSFLTPYGNQQALTIAHDLDHKIVKLLNDAAVE